MKGKVSNNENLTKPIFLKFTVEYSISSGRYQWNYYGFFYPFSKTLRIANPNYPVSECIKKNYFQTKVKALYTNKGNWITTDSGIAEAAFEIMSKGGFNGFEPYQISDDAYDRKMGTSIPKIECKIDGKYHPFYRTKCDRSRDWLQVVARDGKGVEYMQTGTVYFNPITL